MKPFPKTPAKIVTLTIEEDGSQTYLKTDAADIFLECGEVVTRRASHVEPADLPRRIAFSLIRRLVADDSKIAAWTRTWSVYWRINTSPVGGWILQWSDVDDTSRDASIATWRNRQQAIEAEVSFLNGWFARR